jgi:hypothetical protein
MSYKPKKNYRGLIYLLITITIAVYGYLSIIID